MGQALDDNWIHSMTQPLRETPELVLVRDSARQLLGAQWPVERAVERAESPEDLRRLWQCAVDQGWSALELQDRELGLAATLVLQQELGRAECPLPLADCLLADAVLAVSSDPRSGMLRAELQGGHVVPTWCVATVRGNGSVISRTGERLTARLAFIENAGWATHLFLVTGEPGEVLVLPLRDAVIEPTPGFSRPALSNVIFQNVEGFAELRTRFDLDAIAPLARLLLSARALGAAQRGLELLCDYVKVRKQFGQLIGQFQAMQHKLANCLIGMETCRLAVLHAGQAAQLSQVCQAAATASALCGQFLRQIVLETHHGFGGISFWEEHEMPRIFRRVHSDLTRLGGVQASREQIARSLLAPGARLPDLDLGADANSYRSEVRGWLNANWNHRLPEETEGQPLNHRKAWQAFSHKLAAQGWLAANWPREFGGQARSALEQLVYEEEIAYADAPVIYHNAASTMIGPALIRFGSEAQKAHFLPGIAAGNISFALGYSEPDHGSDLGSVRTSARRLEDGCWCINGQKTFTSAAGFATHVWLAARTGPVQARQRGVSIFIVPMDTPGITVQPMHGINGHRSNAVFYDNVVVASDALVGEENEGWAAISAALAFERVSLSAIGARARGYFDLLLEHLQAACPGAAQDSLVLDRIGQLAAQLQGTQLLAVQTANVVESGEVPVHQAAMVKVSSSELMEQLSETVFDLLGSAATLEPGNASAILDGRFEYAVRDALLYTIGGGTNEIQRTLIAQRGLGLPR